MHRGKVLAARWPPNTNPEPHSSSQGQQSRQDHLPTDKLSSNGTPMSSSATKDPSQPPSPRQLTGGNIRQRVQQWGRPQRDPLSSEAMNRESAFVASQSVGAIAARWEPPKDKTNNEATLAEKDALPRAGGGGGPPATLWDLTTAKTLTLLEAPRQVLGLDVFGCLVVALRELGNNECVIAVCDVINRDREYWISPRPGLPCLLNEEEIQSETLLSHGCTVDVGDHFVRFYKSRPNNTFSAAPPSKPKRSNMKSEDNNNVRGPVHTTTVTAADLLSSRAHTPEQLANLASSYIGHEITVYTDLQLTSKELDCLYKCIAQNVEGNEEEFSRFLRNYEIDKKDNEGGPFNAQPGHIIYVLGYFLRVSIEPVEHILIWLKLLAKFSENRENQTYFFLHGVPAIVQGTMSAYVQQVDVQLYCCQILANLAPAAVLTNGKPPLREGAVELVILAMKNHPRDLDVLRCGCQALSGITGAVTAMVKREVYDADTASISSADSVISVVALLLGFIEFIKEHGLPAMQAACAAYPHDDVILEEAEAMRGFLPNNDDSSEHIYDAVSPSTSPIRPGDPPYVNVGSEPTRSVPPRRPPGLSEYQDIETVTEKAQPVSPASRQGPLGDHTGGSTKEEAGTGDKNRYTYAVVNKPRKSSSDSDPVQDTQFENNDLYDSMYDSMSNRAPPLPARPPEYDLTESTEGAVNYEPVGSNFSSPPRMKNHIYSEIGSPLGKPATTDPKTPERGASQPDEAVTPLSNRSYLGEYTQNSPIYSEIPSPAVTSSSPPSGESRGRSPERSADTCLYQDISEILQSASGSYAEVNEPLNKIPEERIYDDIDNVFDDPSNKNGVMRRGSLFSNRRQKARVNNLKGVAAQLVNRGKKYKLNQPERKLSSDSHDNDDGADGHAKRSNIKQIKNAASGFMKKIRKLSTEPPESQSKELPGRWVQRDVRERHDQVLDEMKRSKSHECLASGERGDLVMPRKASTGHHAHGEISEEPSPGVQASVPEGGFEKRTGKAGKGAILKDLMRGKKLKMKKQGSE